MNDCSAVHLSGPNRVGRGLKQAARAGKDAGGCWGGASARANERAGCKFAPGQGGGLFVSQDITFPLALCGATL